MLNIKEIKSIMLTFVANLSGTLVLPSGKIALWHQKKKEFSPNLSQPLVNSCAS
jgi:hypothetical protein